MEGYKVEILTGDYEMCSRDEELSNLIYKAVYSAVMHAWEGCDEEE